MKLIAKDFNAKVYDTNIAMKRGKLGPQEAKIQKMMGATEPQVAPKVFFYTKDSIFMERMDGNIGDFIESPDTMAALWAQVHKKVDIMHSHGIVHNDLKIRNILYKRINDTIEIFLCDFGMAKRLPGPVDEDMAFKTLLGAWKKNKLELFKTTRYYAEIKRKRVKRSHKIMFNILKK